MKTFTSFLQEAKGGCPAATYDLHINLENRQHAIDEYGYGPLNPMEPSKEFWSAKAKMWKVTPEYAKTARCCNCAAFNVTPAMKECMVKGLSDEASDRKAISAIVEKAGMGYCELIDFKCAGDRTCDAWITNGPLEKV